MYYYFYDLTSRTFFVLSVRFQQFFFCWEFSVKDTPVRTGKNYENRLRAGESLEVGQQLDQKVSGENNFLTFFTYI